MAAKTPPKPKRNLTEKTPKKRATRVSFALPSKIKTKMNTQIVLDDYNFREKSKWVCDAIKELSERNGWLDEVFADFLMEHDDADAVNIDSDTMNILNNMVADAIEEYPQIRKGPRSAIIRTAISGRISKHIEPKVQSLD